jgi:hypothetical protein
LPAGAWLGPLGADHTFGTPRLRTPYFKDTGFSGVAVGRRVHAGSVRVGFRLPHDNLRSQKEEISLLFRFWSTKNRIFFGPDLRARFCKSRSRAHHWSSRGTTPLVYTVVVYVYKRRRGLALELLEKVPSETLPPTTRASRRTGWAARASRQSSTRVDIS